MHTFHFPPPKRSLSIYLQVNNQLSLPLTETLQQLNNLCFKWQEGNTGWDRLRGNCVYDSQATVLLFHLRQTFRRKCEKKVWLHLVERRKDTWKLREPQSYRKLTPSTWSSWLLLTNCSRRDVSSFFIKATSPSTVVLFCGKLLISCCCLVTFCGSKETGGKTESDTDRKNRRETGRVTSELMHAN